MAGWKPKDLKNKSFANIQELFDKAMKRVNTFVDMETKLVEGSEEETKMKELIKIIPDEEEVAVDAIPLATKPPSIMLRSFNREDLETLWKLVKAKPRYTRPEEGYERVLWGNLKTMFEHHVEDLRRDLTLHQLQSQKWFLNKNWQADHGRKCVISFLSSSQSNSRINEVFGSSLLVIDEAFNEET
ncbi:hypothetical protein Tco_0660963 [Tanacetum coccineum]